VVPVLHLQTVLPGISAPEKTESGTEPGQKHQQLISKKKVFIGEGLNIRKMLK